MAIKTGAECPWDGKTQAGLNGTEGEHDLLESVAELAGRPYFSAD